MESSKSKFTTYCIPAGLVTHLALYNILMPDLYPRFLTLLGIHNIYPDRLQVISVVYVPDAQNYTIATVLAALGTGLLYLSSRLDFVEDGDDPFKNFGQGIAVVIGGSLSFVILLAWVVFCAIKMDRCAPS